MRHEAGEFQLAVREGLEVVYVERLTGRDAVRVLTRVGGRFASAQEAPTLGWILLHVLQEHARHLGHLDIVRELTDGSVGE